MAKGEADDLRVVMAEVVDSARRAAAAGAAAAMRMQATSLRSTAELFVSQARTLDAFADDVEAGRADLPRMPVRLSVVPLDDAPEVPVVDEPDVPEGTLCALVVDELFEGLSSEMIEWIDLFDDRLRESPFFVEAVNEAADAGCVLGEDTARVVAARIRELARMREWTDARAEAADRARPAARQHARTVAQVKANEEGDGDGG